MNILLSLKSQTKALTQAPLFNIAYKKMFAGFLGTFLWGIVAGLAMMKSGLTLWQCIAMSLVVYSGTAQLAALPLLASGASLIAIFTTGLLVSLRFIIYSAIVAKYFGDLPLLKRLAIGYLTTDSGLATFTSEHKQTWSARNRTEFWAGSNLPVWVLWQIGTFIGLALATVLPDSKAYAFLGLLAIAAMITPLLKNLPSIFCAVTASCVATVATIYGKHWPIGLGTILAVSAGVFAAVLATPPTPATADSTS